MSIQAHHALSAYPSALPRPSWPQPAIYNVSPSLPLASPNISGDQYTATLFQAAGCKPFLQETPQDRLNALTVNPQLYQQLRALQVPEGPVLSAKMINQLMKALPPSAQQQLQSLLHQGVLTQQKADDGHSALYHLYGILTTPRAKGYDPYTILKETIQVLSQPYSISQRFAPITPEVAQSLLHVRNTPGFYGSSAEPPIKPIQPEDLNVENSATCVASSVMYYMADKEPADLARHINELTSPLNAFFEKARFDEISPDNPAAALKVLNDQRISYTISGPGEVLVKVENPPAGVIRAIASQNSMPGKHYRNAIGAAYQSAITHLATHTYDPATDLRDSDVPGETSPGLTEPEKTLMEAIVKNNGSFQSVTYQAVSSKANPAPGEENNSYLYGYNRPFEKTTQDIFQALRMNEPVIVGTTDTDETGAIVAGHEITITGAYTDPQDNQLKFVVADSDDEVDGPVIKTARELIPTIHHAGLPVPLARQINREIQTNQGYLVPDQLDQRNYKLLARENGPMPQEQPDPQYNNQPGTYYPVATGTSGFAPSPQWQPWPIQPFAPSVSNPFQQAQGFPSTMRVAPAA